MASGRIPRLLNLMRLLQRNEPNSAQSLMRELGVSRRTLFRDLQMLADAGVPYRYERKTGYRIADSYYLPAVNLTVTEALGLLLLGKHATNERDRPLMAPAISGIYKLIASLPESLREACAEVSAGVSVSADARIAGDTELRYHGLIQRCIDESRSCRVVYQSPVEHEPLHAVLNPYLLHYVNRAWYVLGYTDVHDEVRMLKLVRFVEIEPTGERFDPPTHYRASDKLGRAWRLLPEGQEYDVVLIFSPKVATNVSEVRWHESQEHEMLDDGSCRMRFKVDGLNEIAWWVCGYADQVTVVKPPQLRDRVAAMLRAALKRYEGTEPSSVVTKAVQPKLRGTRTPNSK